MNFLLVGSQVYIITTGDKFTYNHKLIVSSAFLALIVGILPYLVEYLRMGVNYWVVFAVLVPFGAFSGVQ